MSIDFKNLDLDTFWGKALDYLVNRGLLTCISIVTAYLLIGTIFYAYYNEFGWVGGFNYAVSLAFTIGWQTDLTEKDDWSYLFSTIYIFGGILMMSGILIFVSHLISIHSMTWHHRRIIHKRRSIRLSGLEQQDSIHGYYLMMKLFYNENRSAIISWAVLLVYAIMGVAITSLHDNVNVIEGIYYVISTISTTGAYNPFDDDAENKYFMFTSFYAIGGVVVGSIAIVYLGDIMVKSLMYERLDTHIDTILNRPEYEALVEMEVCQEGKAMTKQEHLINIALRMELIDENFIRYVFEKFDSRPPHLITSSSVRDSTEAMLASERTRETDKLLP